MPTFVRHGLWLMAALAIASTLSTAPVMVRHEATPAPQGTSRHTSSIRGVVRFAQGGIPDAAIVSLASHRSEIAQRTRPDPGGKYAFQRVPPGRYRLSALGITDHTAGHFLRDDIAITPETTGPIVIDVVLVPVP